MQTLKIFQSLWGMELRRPGVAEPSMRENFRKAHEAGYDGICIDPSVAEIGDYREAGPLYREFGLGCMVNAFPYEPDELVPLLQLAAELDACLVNVIGGVMPLRPGDAVPLVRRWMREAAEAGIPLLFETHRDSLLNDMHFTLQLMDEVPEMRLCADLSHFVIDREMRMPVPERDEASIREILERSDCFQGRVANREQIQVQIGFPQHQQWVSQFREWWREGMRRWRRRNPPNAELVFLCELGPRPYAMTDGNQEELSDRWQEALQIREWVRQIWQELDEEERRA